MEKKLLKIKYILLACVIARANIAFSNPEPIEIYDDWTQDVTLEGKNRACLCQGYYKPELVNGVDFGPNLTLTSDEGELTVNEVATLTGAATAEQDNQRLVSDRLKIFFNDNNSINRVEAFGNVRIVTPSERFNGSHGISFIEEKKKELHNSTYRIYSAHAFGESDKILVDENNNNKIIWFDNATYSSCSPLNKTWNIKAKKLKIDKGEGWADAWHNFLYIKKVPVFYWPYINFPVDSRRKTGFLSPSFEKSSYLGKSIGLPLYWNIAPNYDATITPYWTTHSSIRLYNQFRYLHKDFRGVIELDFLPDDRAYKNFRDGKIADPGTVARNSIKMSRLRESDLRYALSVQQVGRIFGNVNYQLSYVRVGDDNYIDNLGRRILQHNLPKNIFTLPIVTNPQQMPQELSATHNSKLGNSTVIVRQYQSLYAFNAPLPSRIYRLLPSFSHTFSQYNYQGFILNSNIAATHFAQKHIRGFVPLTTGNRYHMNMALSRPFDYHPGWFFIPKASVDLLKESLNRGRNLENQELSPRRCIPSYSADLGVVFERDVDHPLFNNIGYMQTLEPRVKYLYTPYKNQDEFPRFDSGPMLFNYDQVFRDNRFSGYDKISAANQVSLGLRTALVDGIGVEKASISIGRIYYLNKLRQDSSELAVSSLSHSPIASRAGYNLNSRLSLSADWVYDTDKKKSRVVSIGGALRPKEFNVINLNYSYLKPITGASTKQISGSFSLFPRDNLLLQSVAHYDFIKQNMNRMAISAEIFNCCYSIKVAWDHTRTLQSTANTGAYSRKYNNAIGLQFTFTGFTSISARRLTDISVSGGTLPDDYLPVR